MTYYEQQNILDTFKELKINILDYMEYTDYDEDNYLIIKTDFQSVESNREELDSRLNEIKNKFNLEVHIDKMTTYYNFSFFDITLTTDEFIKLAFENAKKISVSGGNYQDAMISQRIAGGTNAGSSYDMSADELRKAILTAHWTETTHPNVAEDCKVFTTTDIPKGRYGIRNIEDFPDDTIFYAIDRKDTGFVGIGVPAKNVSPYVDETYLIIGQEEIEGKMEWVVFTFHAGEPLKKSKTSTKEIPDGKKLTKQEALSLGFHHCKLMDEELVKLYE